MNWAAPPARDLMVMAQEQKDPQLADELRCRSKAMFEDVVRAGYKETYGVFTRIVGFDRTAAEDATQEVYLRAFRGLPGFNGEAGFTTWLYRITLNVGNTHGERISRFRRRHVTGDQLAEDLPSKPDSDSYLGNAGVHVDDTFASDLGTPLMNAMMKLTPAARQYLWLHYVEGYKQEEIAEMVGKSETSVKVMIHRARGRLRGIMGSNGISAEDLV